MELREVLPTDEVIARIGEEVIVSEFGLPQLDEICALKARTMLDVGNSIAYRLKLIHPELDLEQFSEAYEIGDPMLFARIGDAIGERTLRDVHYTHVELSDAASPYRTVAELLVAVCSPNMLHIGDVEFSNPRRPIPRAQRTRRMTEHKGFGLLGVLVNRCVTFAQEKHLDSVCLTPAAHDLVPVFEAVGFRLDENELVDLIRQSGMPGPMTLRI